MTTPIEPGWTIPAMEPTDDPEWWRCVDPCDDTCGHPVHARARLYRRKRTDPPGTAERRAMRARGFAWCSGECRAWLPVTEVTKQGQCRPCASTPAVGPRTPGARETPSARASGGASAAWTVCRTSGAAT